MLFFPTFFFIAKCLKDVLVKCYTFVFFLSLLKLTKCADLYLVLKINKKNNNSANVLGICHIKEYIIKTTENIYYFNIDLNSTHNILCLKAQEQI